VRRAFSLARAFAKIDAQGAGRPGRFAAPLYSRWKGADQMAQAFLVDGVGGVMDFEPALLTLVLLGPGLGDLRYRERIDPDTRVALPAVLAMLGVGKRAQRSAVDRTPDAGFLERFTRSSLMRAKTADRITLGDDPAPRIARGD
jgi:hypothetical protein